MQSYANSLETRKSLIKSINSFCGDSDPFHKFLFILDLIYLDLMMFQLILEIANGSGIGISGSCGIGHVADFIFA